MPEPASPLVIVNPAAGMGKAHRLVPRIAAWLREHRPEARVLETREAGHAEQLAAAAAELGHDRVVAVGGDGTVQEVLNGLMAGIGGDRRPALGVVPGGSGNDLSRSLGLPRDPIAALPVALGAELRPLDVGRGSRNGGVRHFATAGGAGFDAQVAHTMSGRPHRWQRGAAGYLVATLNQLRAFRNRDLRVRMETDAGPREMEGRFLFVCFANGAYYGGGMQIAPDAELDDGWLDVCLVGDISRLGALRELPGIYRAAHVNHPLVDIVRAREARIEGDPTARVHLDGEPFGHVPVEVGLAPSAVRVAAGASARVGE
ncbi:MAG TPA: diacylglycerol kinase family protein [Candidatus Limnocylindria bacterium]|nr:diacylglycerol kinase family protein [Candidatus Limnocylindria bacterium]